MSDYYDIETLGALVRIGEQLERIASALEKWGGAVADVLDAPEPNGTKPLDGARCPYCLSDWPAAGRIAQCVRKAGHEGEHGASYYDPETTKQGSVSW